MGTPDHIGDGVKAGQYVLHFDLPRGGFATDWFWPPNPRPKTLAAVDEATPLELEQLYIALKKYRRANLAVLRGRGIRR